MARISIITPTINRQDLLPSLWDCVRGQSVQDIEWRVHDGSPQRASMFDAINDPRVFYTHEPKQMTIGAKRNALCEAAKGEIIAHFDDDDFYAPRYIEGMVSSMTDLNADFVKLFGFFLYHQTHDVFGYWDLERDFPVHWRLHPNEPLSPTRRRGGVLARWGYGFSYVFIGKFGRKCAPPIEIMEKIKSSRTRVIARFKSAGKQDFAGSCLHVIHTTNSSISFP
jgi:glycosyltransferase involved in cell wall biosynthesis